MNTAFATGPGMYAAMTLDTNNPISRDESIPPGCARVYCARIEAYDLKAGVDDLDSVSFTLLPAMADGNPKLAKALLILGEVLQANKAQLTIEASK